MATKFTLKRYNGSNWVDLYPVTSYNNLTDVPSSFSPSEHTHSQYLTGITKDMVTTALGYTPPTSDTNTWRGIQNNLTSTSTTDSLSAYQGKLLKDSIDAINTTLTSNDTDLDTIQEIVTYIKANKTSVDDITSTKQPKTLATALTINGASKTTVEDALSALNTYIGTKTANTGTVTSITLSAGSGISLNATGAITTSGSRTITNSGVRGVSTGTANGTISVNTNGTSANVSVYGLGSAAYVNSDTFATAGHSHALLNSLSALVGGKDNPSFVTVDSSGVFSVDSNTYLTEHQSLSNYSTLSNTIKSLSISGKTITYTKGDNTTGTLTTQDNNTTYSAGTGLSLSSTTFSLASGVATAGTAGTSSATSGSTLAVPYVTVDTYGRVTGYGTHTHTVSGFAASSHTHTKSQITDFPSSMPASDVYSWAKASSKPSYSFSEISSRGEAYLDWGGTNRNGSVSPIGMSLSMEHNPNRLAFINGDLLTMEYSSDAGSTWTDYGLSTTSKSQFCTATYSLPIGRSSSSSEYTTSSKTRITLTAQNGNNPSNRVYTNPKKMLINVTNSGTMEVLVEYRTGANYQSSGSWSTFGTYQLSGWSGWNDIPLILGTLGGSDFQTSNIWQLRLTVSMTKVNSSYPTIAIINCIRIYGENNWYTPSNMANTNHLYSFDMSQNATFPGYVKASTFYNSSGTQVSYVGHTHTKANITDFPSSMPASDVYSWAKASSKPTYTYSEVGAAASSHTHTKSQITDFPTKISAFTNDSGYTTNTGTVTSVAVKMNGSTKGTITSSGTIDLGTVITSHQDISGLAPKASPTFTGTVTLPVNAGASTTGFVKVNESGVISADTNTYALSSHTHNYLPLSGGNLSGTLKFTNSETAAYNSKNIEFNKGTKIGENSNGALGIYAYDCIYLRPNTSGSNYTYGAVLNSAIFRPVSNKGLDLGDSSYYWNNIYGTTIYQNGTKVSVEGHTHISLKANTDNRSVATAPKNYLGLFTVAGLKGNSVIGLSDTSTYGTYSDVIGTSPWSDASGGNSHEIALTGAGGHIMHRYGSGDTWSDWKEVAHTSDIPTSLSDLTNDMTYSDFGAASSGHNHDGSYLAKDANRIVSASVSGQTLTLKDQDDNTYSITNTNTTYSAGTGIGLSGTTFSNTGVRSIATGTANGTISVNTNGTSANVSVYGLGSAAYTASSAYAAASHTHNYSGGSNYYTTGDSLSALSVFITPANMDTWHDHFAFLRAHAILDVQSYSNNTWSDSDLDVTSLFIQKEYNSISILTPSNTAFRFTIKGGYHYSNIYWYELGVNYSTPFSSFTITIEKSEDKSTWTSIYNNTFTSSTTSYYLYSSDPGLANQEYLRFTFTKTTNLDTGYVSLSCLRGLTSRKGNQGLGKENQLPFVYDKLQDIYPANDNTSLLGTSSYQWKELRAVSIFENNTSLASKYAALSHTHTASLATDTGTSAITLALGSKYKLTAGGSSVIFTMPSKPSYSFTGSAVTSGANSGTAITALTGVKVSSTGDCAPSGHTHSVTASGTVSLGSNTTSTDGIAYVEPSVSGTTLTLTVKYFHPSFTGSAVTSGANSGTAVSAATAVAANGTGSCAPSSHTHSVTASGSVS